MMEGMQVLAPHPRPCAATPVAVPAARRQRGFTLIELMVVLAIIGVLAALIVPNVLGRADDARITAARTDVGNVMQALKLYKLDNQRFPTTEQGLEALVRKPTAGPPAPNWKPYLDKLPADPWGNAYGYLNPGVQGEVVCLFGPGPGAAIKPVLTTRPGDPSYSSASRVGLRPSPTCLPGQGGSRKGMRPGRQRNGSLECPALLAMAKEYFCAWNRPR